MFLAELSGVVPLFRGHVLKYGGDGLIAFMPGPSQNHQNDLAIDCALTMHMLVYAAMNPMLEEAGLPLIEVRIGIDAGEASVRVLGSSATKRHADIIGQSTPGPPGPAHLSAPLLLFFLASVFNLMTYRHPQPSHPTSLLHPPPDDRSRPRAHTSWGCGVGGVRRAQTQR